MDQDNLTGQPIGKIIGGWILIQIGCQRWLSLPRHELKPPEPTPGSAPKPLEGRILFDQSRSAWRLERHAPAAPDIILNIDQITGRL